MSDVNQQSREIRNQSRSKRRFRRVIPKKITRKFMSDKKRGMGSRTSVPPKGEMMGDGKG